MPGDNDVLTLPTKHSSFRSESSALASMHGVKKHISYAEKKETEHIRKPGFLRSYILFSRTVDQQ